MLFFNKCTENSDTFSVDEDTEDFCIGVFGFFPHNMADNLSSFLMEDLNVSCAITMKSFKFGGNKYLKGYSVCDRRTFDESYVFPMIFESKDSALGFINSAISKSEWVSEDTFSDIVVLDAYKVSEFVAAMIDKENAKKNAEELLKEELKMFRAKLRQKYANNDVMMSVIAKSVIGKI